MTLFMSWTMRIFSRCFPENNAIFTDTIVNVNRMWHQIPPLTPVSKFIYTISFLTCGFFFILHNLVKPEV